MTMSDFFKNLKAKRESQGIELEEIHNRTKINLDYLKAIENGQLDILPKTYVRLFLRAYVLEIGGDPNEALSEMELSLGQEPKKQKTSASEEKPTPFIDKNKPVLQAQRSPLKIRSDVLKGIGMVLLAIFAIYIIRTINAKNQVPEELYTNYTLEEEGISEIQLTNDYDLLTNVTEQYDTQLPLNIKVVATQRAWYRVEMDTASIKEQVLPAGDNRLHGFSEKIDLLFNHTNGLKLYINGNNVKNVDGSNHPVRVTVFVDPKTITIRRFIPKS